MRSYILFAVAVLSSVAFADTLTLKNGETIKGSYLGGDSRQIRLAVGDKIETFDISQVSAIQFGQSEPERPAPAVSTPPPAPAAPSPNAAPSDPPGILKPQRPIVAGPSGAAGEKRPTEIPAGTALVIRMIDDVDSERDRVGQEFKASIDEPVMVNGQVIVPRQADVVVKLVDDKEASRIAGRTELTLDILSVQVDGRMVDVTTQVVTTTGENRTKRTGVGAAGGAALGAVIGAIAGGGKGAAIGAVAGGGAGAAAAIVTKGPKVKIPSETRLTFEMQYPVRL